MPADPFVVASATRTLAVVSKTPTATIAASQARQAAGSRPTRASARTSASAVDVPRAVTIVHGTLLVRGRVEPDDEEPERERGDQRERDAGRERRPSSGAGLAGEQHDAAEHRDDAGPLGRRGARRPAPRSTASGTIGLAAEIGATIPIAPTAIPR